ncbi:hypothetical protein O0L34_g1882 [Tuta absoluta]|nr:hypothetical protein O0L34_g1882 [Tuta absoluta]
MESLTPKKANKAESLGIGYHALKKKLTDIFITLSSKNDILQWPEKFKEPIRSERDRWLIYKLAIASVKHEDKDRNIALINHASSTFLSLSTQCWDQDLWVILCEYISEMVKDEVQYNKLIEVVLQAAKYEVICIKRRLENLVSLVTENPWWTLFKNVEQILVNAFQKCEFYIFFFALSEQQKTRIYDHLSQEMNDSADNMRSHLNLLMTHVCWENLLQLTKLLKEKRVLLRLLSSATPEELESTATTDTASDHDIEYEPQQEYKQEPVIIFIETEQKKAATQACGAERVKIKWELNTPQENIKLKGSNKQEISSDFNLSNTIDSVKIKTETIKEEDSIVKNENNKIKLNEVKNESDVPEDIKSTTITEQITRVKLEPNVSEAVEKDFKPVKEENIEEEDNILVLIPSPPEIIEVKNEELNEESASKVQENYQAKETKDIVQNKQTLVEVSSSLDKLILQMSLQQINKIVLSSTIIEVSEDDDDEDDCMIQEDSKLEVGQLLNMYHKIILDQPKKLVKNPLADQKNMKINEIETDNFIKLCDDNDNFAVPQEVSAGISERNPSTSSSTTSKSSKMKVPMSARKRQNQMKRNQSKTNASVKKLFEKLRNESQISLENKSQSSQNVTQPSCSKEENTVEENSIVVLDDTITPKKRKRKQNNDSPKGNKKYRYFGKSLPNSSTFLTPITVDNTIELTPEKQEPQKKTSMHCSTPIQTKSKTQSNFIPLVTKISKPENNNKSSKNFNEEVTDLTKEINRDSYLTIDLTAESLNCSSISKAQNTVIDLDNTVDPDCTVVSVDNDNLSISGESDVTVINMGQAKKDRRLHKFVKGIAKLDAAEKGKLLELITQNIFNGCKVVDKKKSSLHNEPSNKSTRVPETAEDTYIKEVILGQTPSRNSIGSNIYNPERDSNRTGLRMIVIDGSNVAVEHGRKKVFSVKGLKICIDYFLKRGHVVKAFVPRFRCRRGKSTDGKLLDKLEEQGLVVYTPSREVRGRMITPYDDRYIVQCAAEFDGVIVSGDNYRDLIHENPRWRFIIENRLLMFTWVNDMIMFPKDPLGRNGVTLEQFLRHPSPTPKNQQSHHQNTNHFDPNQPQSYSQPPSTFSQPPPSYFQEPFSYAHPHASNQFEEQPFPRH